MKTSFLTIITTLVLMLCTSAYTATKVTPSTTDAPANQKKPAANPKYRIDTNQGSFTIELFPNEAPKTVANFIHYINSGFYIDTIFHRIIPDFVMQGGGFDESLHKKKTGKAIINESSTMLKNKRGTLSMARLNAPNSATSQFFINLKNNSSLDKSPTQKGYAVFGQVIDGMHIIERLSYNPTGNVGMYQNVPKTPIKITRITQL